MAASARPVSTWARRPSITTAPEAEERDRPRQEPVLDGVDPRREAGLVVAGEHRDRLLEQDRSAVERLVDEVDRDAGHRRAVGQGIGHGMGAGESRQERRVDVEDPAAERCQHRRADDPHVAGEHDDVDVDRGQGLGERRIVAARHQRGLEPLLGRPVECRAGPVGEDEDDGAAKSSPFARGRQRPQVRARPRDTDRDPRGVTHTAPSRAPST